MQITSEDVRRTKERAPVKNMKEPEETKVVIAERNPGSIAERYPDPSIEDLQLYDNLFSLPGDEVNCKEEHDVSDIIILRPP